MLLVQEKLQEFPAFYVEYDQHEVPFFKATLLEYLRKINGVAEGRTLLAKIAQATPAVRNDFPPGVNVKCVPQRMYYTAFGVNTLLSRGADNSVVSITARPILELDVDVNRGGVCRFKNWSTGSQNVGRDPVAGGGGGGCVCLMRFANGQAITKFGETAPAFIVLAHELIHSWHHLYGIAKDGRAEEEWTTGIGEYTNSPMTENAFRRAFRLSPRERYY
jgi:hypothetical protein